MFDMDKEAGVFRNIFYRDDLGFWFANFEVIADDAAAADAHNKKWGAANNEPELDRDLYDGKSAYNMYMILDGDIESGLHIRK